MKTVKMHFVIDATGRIVGAAHPDSESSVNGISVGIRALPGQQIVEADVPSEIATLTSGRDFNTILSTLKITPHRAEIDFTGVQVKRVKH
jgi:hypothetical protein